MRRVDSLTKIPVGGKRAPTILSGHWSCPAMLQRPSTPIPYQAFISISADQKGKSRSSSPTEINSRPGTPLGWISLPSSPNLGNRRNGEASSSLSEIPCLDKQQAPSQDPSTKDTAFSLETVPINFSVMFQPLEELVPMKQSSIKADKQAKSSCEAPPKIEDKKTEEAYMNFFLKRYGAAFLLDFYFLGNFQLSAGLMVTGNPSWMRSLNIKAIMGQSLCDNPLLKALQEGVGLQKIKNASWHYMQKTQALSSKYFKAYALELFTMKLLSTALITGGQSELMAKGFAALVATGVSAPQEVSAMCEQKSVPNQGLSPAMFTSISLRNAANFSAVFGGEGWVPFLFFCGLSSLAHNTALLTVSYQAALKDDAKKEAFKEQSNLFLYALALTIALRCLYLGINKVAISGVSNAEEAIVESLQNKQVFESLSLDQLEARILQDQVADNLLNLVIQAPA